ncbi:hypothetical protein [Streptomyces sp. NPDC059076]
MGSKGIDPALRKLFLERLDAVGSLSTVGVSIIPVLRTLIH